MGRIRRILRAVPLWVLTVPIAGCATPIAQRYYASCIEAGHAAAECEMRAIEVNQRALAGFSESMRQASDSFRAAGEQFQGGPSIDCVTVNHGGPVTHTTCH